MRNIVIMRGIPGVGKSTFIRERGLEPWTISSDTLRNLLDSPIQDENGCLNICQSSTNEVFNFVYYLIERKMKNREFIIFDATNIELNKFQKLKKLVETYRYKAILLDFSNTSIETCIEQNKNRKFKVPNFVIEKMYNLLLEENKKKIPSWLNVVNPNDFDAALNYEIQDFSNFKKIHHIGDIHGCYTVLKEYLNGNLKEDELYIFLGDYLDRGIENLEVLNFLSAISTKKNVILLEGNHEIHLWNYANNLEINSHDFDYRTKKQIESFEKHNIRRLYRKLRPFVFYNYNGKKVFVCHGGITFNPNELYKIPEKQFIHGVGKYSTDVNEYWDTKNNGIYQIHGHRNTTNKPISIKDSKVFNLEGKVEFGENLRVLTLDVNGFKEFYVKNNVVNRKHIAKTIDINLSKEEYLNILRDDNSINEKKFSNNISSFNFSREVFWRGDWNIQNIKARGLFLNTKSYEIIARSYDKFFNIGEIEDNVNLIPNKKGDNLLDNLNYPLIAYEKENGFLGITGYDTLNDCPIIASKSTINGLYRNWFNDILKDTLKDNFDEFFKDLKRLNLSAVFEVIDVVNDPHLIEYKKSNVILLDLIKREQRFSKLNYNELLSFAAKYNLSVKQKAYILQNEKDFIDFKNKCSNNDIKLEGYVLEDTNGFMFKVKLPFYLSWKKIRNFLEKNDGLIVGKDYTNFNEEEVKIINFIIKNSLFEESIITIQRKYYI